MTKQSLAKANDWRKSGDELFAELASKWVAFLLAIHNREAVDLELFPGFAFHLEPTRPPRPEFADAITKYENGDPSDLIDYLYSDRPVGRQERDALVWLLKRNSRGSPHRPPNASLRYAATLAMAIYEEWRDRNRKRGIANHGRANEMRHATARFVGETFFEVDEGAAEEVLELMSRSKMRREFTGGLVTFGTGFVASISPKKCSHNP